MGFIVSLLASMLAVWVSASLLPGVEVDTLSATFWAAVVLGVVNAILKPILVILTLPINLLTLGLFTFVINAVIVLLASALVPGFRVDGFIWALLFSLVMGAVNTVVGSLVK